MRVYSELAAVRALPVNKSAPENNDPSLIEEIAHDAA
jgi:hypothetical protein